MKFAFVLMVALFLGGCDAHSQSSTASTLCYAIEREDAELQPLVEQVGNFFEERSLVTDNSHPLVIEFELEKTGETVSVVKALGQYGTVLIYFKGDTLESSLEAHVIELIQHELHQNFTIQECNDIEGFRMPKLWN